MLAAVSALLGSLPGAAGGEPAAHAAAIRALVEKSFDVESGPGVAILVARDGTPLFLGGFGLADLESGRKITPDSLFDLAPVSKHMTAVAILTLVEKGKLQLDGPLAKVLGDFRVPVKGRAVTVGDLLHHVSGLRDYTSSGDWDGTDDGGGYGLGWFVDKSRPLVYHGGSWDGTSTYLLMDRRDGYTVAVLSNDENAESGQLAESRFL